MLIMRNHFVFHNNSAAFGGRARPKGAGRTLFLCAPILIAASCSSPDPTNLQAQTATGDERDTEIKHEPCEMGSPTAVRMDVNGDGQPDIINVLKDGREVCRIVDLNFDGGPDAFIYYDAQGFERRRESDFDRDGRADEIAHYQGGLVVLKERETNFDDKLDTWDHYVGGRLARRERDSDGDSIVDQWWSFNNPADPKCAIVYADRNADRKPDPDSVLDLCAQTYGVPADLAQPPPNLPYPGAPPNAAPGNMFAPNPNIPPQNAVPMQAPAIPPARPPR